MDTEYNKVSTIDDVTCEEEKFSWKLFMRQAFVASSTWVMFFVSGLYLGAPTVFIPQLRREANSTAAVSDEMASWISAGTSYGAIPWNFIGTAFLSIIGRKNTYACYSVASVIVAIFFYFSHTPTYLLIAEILHGLTYSATLTVSIPILAEYTSPKYRGVFLTIKTATLYWGIWSSNAIGTFFHWRYISILAIICSLYNLSVFFWPESPYYLASKGRFDECKKAHRWVKGTGKYAEEELQNLLMSNRDFSSKKDFKFSKFLRHIIKTLTCEEYYRPLMAIILCITMYFFSGKIVYTIYAVEMIKRITNSESAAYTGMLILDGATVFSMYVGCYLSKILKRRTLLFASATVAIMFLFTISVYLYLIHLGVFTENKYASISLLVGFSLSVSCGPVIMATSLYGELTPMKDKSLTVFIFSIVFAMLQSFLLKISPFLFRTLKMHGTFLLFAISMSIFMILLYRYLPETKDKTLQEIEDCFKYRSKGKNNGVTISNSILLRTKNASNSPDEASMVKL